VRLVVGLGNPGPRYARTRHNVGAMVVDELAARRGGRFRKQRHADVAVTEGLVLAKPTTFMNRSGTAVLALLARHGVRPEAVVAVHDDLDLPLGRLRVKQGGGAGGQRGVQDIIDRVGPGFVRVRIGVSRPPDGWPSERWVLSRFSPDEADVVTRVVATAADAVLVVIEQGTEAAMNAVNGLDLAAPESTEPTSAPQAPDV
jgi:peptidyl-tRNA hydrolase, PTH1 family